MPAHVCSLHLYLPPSHLLMPRERSLLAPASLGAAKASFTSCQVKYPSSVSLLFEIKGWTSYKLHCILPRVFFAHYPADYQTTRFHIQIIRCPSHGHWYRCENDSHLCWTCQSPGEFENSPGAPTPDQSYPNLWQWGPSISITRIQYF